MFGIVPGLFSANIGIFESVDGVVLLLSETVAGLRWYRDLVDRGVRGLDTCTGMSVVVDSVVFLFFFWWGHYGVSTQDPEEKMAIKWY